MMVGYGMCYKCRRIEHRNNSVAGRNQRKAREWINKLKGEGKLYFDLWRATDVGDTEED